MNIRSVTAEDAGQICSIYNWYIEKTFITFEEVAVTVSQMQQRIGGVSRVRPWVVLEEGGTIQGYAYAGEWKSRSAYRYAVETTVYLDKDSLGRGYGSLLYANLFERLGTTPVRTLIAGIALPNEGSVALHEKMGFRKVAHFENVGFKFDRWIDVGYWQRTLNGSETGTNASPSSERMA